MKKKLFASNLVPLIITISTCWLFSGCSNINYDFPVGYDLKKPQVQQLGKVMNEISGLAYDPVGPSLIAISDSKDKIIQIGLKTKKLKDLKEHIVGPDSDIEDIVASDTAYYLLSSWGEIVEVPVKATDSTTNRTFDLNLPGQNDFETLYFDPTANGLILICKTCAHEKGKNIRTAFRFDLQTRTFDSLAFFTFSKDEVQRILKDDDVQFDPSAAAIHPINKRLYILSAASHLLVIADTRGKIMEAYKLNPDLFPQAEGIAFAPNGDMYISNEGKFGSPTLLFFPYKTPGNKTSK
jgi:uncharacterized protein YjiK